MGTSAARQSATETAEAGVYTYIYIYIYRYIIIVIIIVVIMIMIIIISLPCSTLRSAQVRAYDERAECRKTGSPYKRAYALSSCALTYMLQMSYILLSLLVLSLLVSSLLLSLLYYMCSSDARARWRPRRERD